MKPGSKILLGIALIMWTVSLIISAYNHNYAESLWALLFIAVTICISRI